MSDTLRDQLLGLGFKPPPGKAERAAPESGKPPPRQRARPAKPHAHGQRAQKQQAEKSQPGRRQHNTPQHGGPQRDTPQTRDKPGSRHDIDLARAYAIRAQRDKDERIEAERLKQEQARKRREAKARLAELLKDKALNDPAADIARHFDYGGKIKRIYVNAAQLKALNNGELGVVQLDGRYLLVSASLLAEAEAIFAPAVALRVDPDARADDDPYAEPRYRVPDDLVW